MKNIKKLCKLCWDFDSIEELDVCFRCNMSNLDTKKKKKQKGKYEK